MRIRMDDKVVDQIKTVNADVEVDYQIRVKDKYDELVNKCI